MSKHTPGPWRAAVQTTNYRAGRKQWCISAGHSIAQVTTLSAPGESGSNARLIAAAPLMYDLLHAVLDTCIDDPNPKAFDATLDEIHNLLADLAEGKQ